MDLIISRICDSAICRRSRIDYPLINNEIIIDFVDKRYITSDYIGTVSKGNLLGLFKYLTHKNLLISEFGFEMTIEGGSLTVIKYIMSKYKITEVNKNTINIVAANGDVEMLKYLKTVIKGPLVVGQHGIYRAVENGHAEMIKYLQETQSLDLKVDDYINMYILNDNFEMLKNLPKNFQFNVNKVNMLIKNNKLDMLKYLHNNFSIIVNDDSMIEAVKNCNLEATANYLHEVMKISFDVYSLDYYAALVIKNIEIKSSQRINTIEYLISRGLHITNHEIQNTIIYGDVEMVHFMIDNYKEPETLSLENLYNSYTATYVVIYNDLEMVKWLYNQIKEPYDKNLYQISIDNAITRNKVQILRFLISWGSKKELLTKIKIKQSELTYKVEMGQYKIAKELIKNFPYLKIPDMNNRRNEIMFNLFFNN